MRVSRRFDRKRRDRALRANRPARVFEVSRFVHPNRETYSPPKQRLWLHLLLVLARCSPPRWWARTCMYNFSHNLPFFDIEQLLTIFSYRAAQPVAFLAGLPFSLTLLTILMAHELGHYLACVYYRRGRDAAVLSAIAHAGDRHVWRVHPDPLGASANKRVLFDIGIAGPLAGFIFLLPALGVGLAFSKVLPGINHQGTIQLGVPAAAMARAAARSFPGVPARIFICIRWRARRGWGCSRRR